MSKTAKSKKSKQESPKVHKIKAQVTPQPKSAPVASVKKPAAQSASSNSAQGSNSSAEAASAILARTKSKRKPSRPKKRLKFIASLFMPVIKFNRYLKSSWQEIKKVHWPNRKSAWAMTLAVIGYLVFFLVLVLVLDNIFSYLFKLMMGR